MNARNSMIMSTLHSNTDHSSSLQIRFFMETNIMNPDQTAPLGSGSILFTVQAT